MKNGSEARKHMRAGCSTSKSEPKNFAPPQNPFPGARDGQNLISLINLITFTYKPNLVRIDARNFEVSW